MNAETKKMGFFHRIFEGFTAIAFAEAGEFEYAKKIVKEADLEPKRELSYLEKVMAAVAFAEAGEFEYAKDWIKKEESEFEVKSRHLEGLIETSIETAAATAFAEAGEHYQAVSIIGRLKGKRLLIVCEGDDLPEKLMQQGLELAEKMGLEVVVLNIFIHTMASNPSAQREIWRDEFRKRAKSSLDKWIKRTKNVKISQIIEFGDPAKILQEVLLKVQGIRYILSLKDLIQPKEDLAEKRIEEPIPWKH